MLTYLSHFIVHQIANNCHNLTKVWSLIWTGIPALGHEAVSEKDKQLVKYIKSNQILTFYQKRIQVFPFDSLL